MLGEKTKVNKLLSKSKLFNYYKTELSPKRKSKFDEDISRIYISNEISEASMDIVQGEKVNRIFVLDIILKKEEFDSYNIYMLSKYFNSHILYKLIFDKKVRLGIFEDKLYLSETLNLEDLDIQLKGRNLDTIWENLVLDIAGYTLEEDKSLEEQLELEEKRKKLKNQIETLDKKGRREKQQIKKFEIHQEVQRLKRELEELV